MGARWSDSYPSVGTEARALPCPCGCDCPDMGACLDLADARWPDPPHPEVPDA